MSTSTKKRSTKETKQQASSKNIDIPQYEVPKDPEDYRYTASFALNEEQQIKSFFEEFGFVVIRDVLTQAECDATMAEIYEILGREDSGFDANNVSTWSNWPSNSIPQYSSPQREPIFKRQFLLNRTNPNVHRAFATVLSEDDLLVNHDRCCFFRPTRDVAVVTDSGVQVQDKPEWRTKDNIHIDMNPWKWLGDGSEARAALAALRYNPISQFIFENNQASHTEGAIQVQATINLLDNHTNDGGFQAVPGFHRHFNEYFASVPRREGDNSYLFSAKEQHVLRNAVRVTMRAGSIVLWDQRIPHGSAPNYSASPRSAMFLKMYPRRLVADNVERAKARAAAINRQLEMLPQALPMTPLTTRLLGLDLA